jgi:hypothetical protein
VTDGANNIHLTLRAFYSKSVKIAKTEPQKWATGVEAVIFFLPNLVPDLADLERNNSKSQFLNIKGSSW